MAGIVDKVDVFWSEENTLIVKSVRERLFF